MMLALRLKKGAEKEVSQGFPWVYQGEYIESSEQMLAQEGELAELRDMRDRFIGIGYFNPRSQIALRLLTRVKEAITAEWFFSRLEVAQTKRAALYGAPYYRMVHAESDGLPGLLIDRFGDIYVLQIGTAGMERLLPMIVEALEMALRPAAIVLRNDIRARDLEGLSQEVRILKGAVADEVEVVENDCRYVADLLRGQKTGWFYDQRDNRALIGGLAKGKTLLDIYAHSGGFGIVAAKKGATSVTMVDSSALALSMARKAAALNHVEQACDYFQGDALRVMEALFQQGKRYGVVVADPPAFVKMKKDMQAGLRGYQKVARSAAALVEGGGFLMVASCSHHAVRAKFEAMVLKGVQSAGRKAEIVARGGAGRDHPIHPHLAQSAYLKAVLLRLA